MRPPFDHFDLIARWYDRVFRRRPDDPILDLLEMEPRQVLLDVGGGTGRITQRLEERGVRVILCDLSRRMAREAGRKGLSATVGSVARLPFLDNAVDRVLVVDAFHHFTYPSPAAVQTAAAGELVRVLRPGGLLLIEEPDIEQMSAKAIAAMEAVLLMRSRFLSGSTLTGMLQQAGGISVTRQSDAFSYRLICRKTA